MLNALGVWQCLYFMHKYKGRAIISILKMEDDRKLQSYGRVEKGSKIMDKVRFFARSLKILNV